MNQLKDKKYRHLVNNVPNNCITRYIVRKINQKMVRSQSLFKLDRRYRKPKAGYTYGMFGDLVPKQRTDKTLPVFKRGKVFSLYLRNR